MAPGAAMVGLKAFSQYDTSSTSATEQAIDYAVNVDHVDVISESFVQYHYPDLGSAPLTWALHRWRWPMPAVIAR